jgi:hypothetical protein
MKYPNYEWRQIDEFPDYWISDHGHIVDMNEERVIRPYTNGEGLKCVRLKKSHSPHSRGFPRGVDKLM